MREIATIREKFTESLRNEDHVNGFKIIGFIAGDHGSVESTTDFTLMFTGFKLRFLQTKWLVRSDDTLYIYPTVTGIEGIEDNKVAYFANETAKAVKEIYFEGQLEEVQIQEAIIKKDESKEL